MSEGSISTFRDMSDSTHRSILQLTGMISNAHLRAEERAKATHERFNVFTTLLSAHDEVRLHTRFLHCLLDPKGSHDCGSLFLELFFETLTKIPVRDHLGESVSFDCLQADVHWVLQKETGRSSGHGQIDLLITRCGFGIAIENKIHARDQDGQLAGYAEFLADRYPGNWRLIYLTLDGKKSNDSEKIPYLRISYTEHILSWLELCLERTFNIIPVNQVILQYRKLVRDLTGKTMSDESLKSIARFVIDHPDIIRYREQLEKAIDEAEVIFMEELGASIVRRLESEFQIRLEPPNGRFGSGNDEELVISALNGKPFIDGFLKVCIEYDTTGDLLAIGVFTTYDQNKQQLSESQTQIIEKIKSANTLFNPPNNKPTAAWPLGWYNLLEGLDDAGFATLTEEGADKVAIRVCDKIREYLCELSRVMRDLGTC
jgi:hypothetical protein